MAVNLPAYDKSKFSFGPGVLRLYAYATGEVPGAIAETSLSDVGGVRSGGSFSVGRTRLDVFQGSPRELADTYITEETATLTCNSIEWNLTNLSNALGAGNVTGPTGKTTTLDFGGSLTAADVAVSFTHVTPAGSTVTIRLWRAKAGGDFSVTFGDDIHEIPMSFSAAGVTGHWGVGQTAATDERLFQVTFTDV